MVQELKAKIIHLHKHPEDEDSIECATHAYFVALSPQHWANVASEGRGLIAEVTGQPLQEEELPRAVLNAVAAQSFYSALNIIANALGLNAETLAYAADETQGLLRNCTEPMTFEKFKEELENYGPLEPR